MLLPQTHHDCSHVNANRNHHLITHRSARRATGFSLVEIMVGMVMGLLGMIVMFQMLTLFEAQKRTTTGGNDAQNGAAISLHTLQQDIEQAGYGISEMGLLGCNIAVTGQTVPVAPVIINPATTIIPAGDTNTDRLLISYGNSNGIAEGNVITALAGTVYSVQLPSSFSINDRVFATANPCAGALLMDRVSVAPIVGVQTVTVASGVAVTVPATLYNLGQSPQVLAYAIRRGSLTVCDFLQNNCSDATPSVLADHSVWLPIANNIVSLRAEYGHDDIATAGGTAVRNQTQINAITNATVPPTPAPNYVVNKYDQTTPTTNCGWVRTPAIRLALVARGQYEKPQVPPLTTDAPIWAGSKISTTTPPFHLAADLTPIYLTADGDWQNYRYKVLETVVPIRNVTWMGVQAGC